jgi:hypothetical protein
MTVNFGDALTLTACGIDAGSLISLDDLHN